jgi:hypothetical protein
LTYASVERWNPEPSSRRQARKEIKRFALRLGEMQIREENRGRLGQTHPTPLWAAHDVFGTFEAFMQQAHSFV